MIDLHDAEERDAAAGEYVLGTLSREDHTAFEAALAQDAPLRAGVYAWQDRLLGLSAKAVAVSPRPQLWQRIDAALNARPAVAPASKAAPRLPWWQGLRLWQGVSALALATTFLLAVLLVGRIGMPDGTGARYLAVLQSPDNQATGWVVELQAGRSLRLVPVAATAPVPAGRALQFWTKPQGAEAPTSLGLVRTGQTLELPVSRLPAVGAQQLFEITLEPESGSPTGRPTGPILYVGRTVAL